MIYIVFGAVLFWVLFMASTTETVIVSILMFTLGYVGLARLVRKVGEI